MRPLLLYCASLQFAQSRPPFACIPPFHTFPFCDSSLSLSARVADLISRLGNSSHGSFFKTQQDAIPELGVPAFNWYTEALHGLINTEGFCLNDTLGGARCASSFPAAGVLGATFNRSLLRAVGSAIGDEIRAFSNANASWTAGKPVDPAAWLPNLNIGRDPRWGRQVETFGEDPTAIGVLGGAMIDGAQYGLEGRAAGGFLKVVVAAKHATAYQFEQDRFSSAVNLSSHDLADTYLPAWELAVSCATPHQGCASGFMCAYDAVSIDGGPLYPMCASPWLRRTLEGFGLDPAASYAQSDCRAVDSARRGALANLTPAGLVGFILNASAVDKDCPGHQMPALVGPAVAGGFAPPGAVLASLSRTLALQFKAGRFDPSAPQPYAEIAPEVVDGASARALSWEGAQQGAVLLRNDGGLLPLRVGSRVACVGPFCNATYDLLGNYFAARCAGGGYDCVPTLAAGLATANGGAPTPTAAGCDVNDGAGADIPGAVAVARGADVVVLALGTNAQCPPARACTAAEGRDRADTSLPGAQGALAGAVLALGKPTVAVFVSGSALGFDALLAARAAPLAVVWGGHPGGAGAAPLAMQLFGGANRWGKLPHTLYPLNYTRAMPITDMSMVPNAASGNVGRTYKYYAGPVLFPAFWGLSYTNFSLAGSCNVSARAPLAQGEGVACTAVVANVGAMGGDEVVTLFVRPPQGSDPAAVKRLVDFARVTVGPGENVSVPFNVSWRALAEADGEGHLVVRRGTHAVVLSTGGGGAPDVVAAAVAVERDERVRQRAW